MQQHTYPASRKNSALRVSFSFYMALPYYDQPQISVAEQIELLKSEKLTFSDENKAQHILENISLFRMKSYLVSLRKPHSRQFKEGTSFEDAYSLYKFDSALRKMICSELEKIEVSIRTQLSLIMSDEAGIYWFENPANFRNVSRPATLLTFEISSFGSLSIMYKWLKAGHARRKMARFYGLSDTVMESWLHSIVYLRNICAHHNRLWNRRLSINALVPRNTYLPFINIPQDTKKVYYILSIILYLLQAVNPQNTFAARFKSLLAEYPKVDTVAMGFPGDWENETLWQ